METCEGTNRGSFDLFQTRHPLVTEDALGKLLPSAGTLPRSFTRGGVVCRGRRVESAFHAVDYRTEADILQKCFPGFDRGRLRHRGSDLVVGIGGDVFHQEVNETRIALQEREGSGRRRRLARTLHRGAWLRSFRRGYFLWYSRTPLAMSFGQAHP